MPSWFDAAMVFSQFVEKITKTVAELTGKKIF
jgi:hypothetical protein